MTLVYLEQPLFEEKAYLFMTHVSFSFENDFLVYLNFILG